MNKRIKILVVDDETPNLQIMSEMLKAHHNVYEPYFSDNGEEALEIIHQRQPDIVLLDVRMEGMDGYSVCRKIREDETSSLCKIILVSGLTLIGDRLEGYRAGADDYITKPFIEEELLAKIAVYSKLRRMEEVDGFKSTALNLLSHETRTPLNGVLLGTELLSEQKDLSQNAKRYVEIVRESGLRIQRLIDRISRYCNLKDGIILNRSSGFFNDKTEKLHEDLTTKSGNKLERFFHGDLILSVDWQLFLEAYEHILMASSDNCDPDGRMHLHGRKTGKGVLLKIESEGKKLESGLEKNIFDGLYKPDILHHSKGTGLGLAIAREIIEAHGGVIDCYNGEKGIVFEISLEESPSTM